MKKLLYKLTAGLPCLLIKTNDQPYLERYHVATKFGVSIYLHRFVSNDAEEHIHNHPWKRGFSIILRGSYVEQLAINLTSKHHTGCVVEEHTRRWFNVVNHNTMHRIHSAEPETWSLFIHGKRHAAGWGFIQRAIVNNEFVALFRNVPSATSQWWLNKPAGRDAGREPLK